MSLGLPDFFEAAHKRSSHHRADIERSENCGCFSCCEVFTVDKIKEWTDDDQTAMCPQCGVDAVIGDATGYRIEGASFLQEMRTAWFGDL